MLIKFKSKLSIIVLLSTLIVTFMFQVTTGLYLINEERKEKISFLHKDGISILDNQIDIIEHRLTNIKNYINILSNITSNLKAYNENRISNKFKKLFFTDLGIFQLRLLDHKGKELIRYDLKNNNIEKATTLQNKSNRYYFKKAENLKIDDIYISPFDLNVEHNKIEIPYKNTIRIIKKIKISNEILYITINYNITRVVNYAFKTTLYDIFLIENDNQINLHLNNNYSFSKQKSSNIYLKDLMTIQNQYITKKNLIGFPYKIVISIKKSKLIALEKAIKSEQRNLIIVSIIISLLITIILFIVNNQIYRKKLNQELIMINNTLEDKVSKRTEELKKLEFKTTQILNAQANFLLLSNGVTIQQANNTMLEFLGYKTLEEFKEENTCICDFFIEEDGYLQKSLNDKPWIEVILEDLNIAHKVKINDKNNNEHIFKISVSNINIDQEDIYVITFSDITELVNKELRLFQTEKLVSMGEMIGNISHQWRQPLNAISVTSNNLVFKCIMDEMDADFFKKELTLIDKYTQYLSNTIDDFKNYIKGDRSKSNFLLHKSIDSFLNLSTPLIKNDYIDLILDIKNNITVYGYENELNQCLINIFNNAKDALDQKNIDNKLIFISTNIKNNKATITIKDNAGGIPNDILSKIFEPYFTTKHKSQGTGLGLHMAHNLIVDGMDGTLDAKNATYIYKNKEYIGAEFTITLPLS